MRLRDAIKIAEYETEGLDDDQAPVADPETYRTLLRAAKQLQEAKALLRDAGSPSLIAWKRTVEEWDAWHTRRDALLGRRK